MTPEPDPEPTPDPKYVMMSSSTSYTINGATWHAWDAVAYEGDNYLIGELGSYSNRRFLTPPGLDGSVVETYVGVIGSSSGGTNLDAYINGVRYHSSDSGVTFTAWDNSFPADFAIDSFDYTKHFTADQELDFGRSRKIYVQLGEGE